jgi:prepilin peptidase CpaA
MNPLPLPVEVCLVVMVLIAAGSDIRSRTIPNWLTVGGILAGLALHSYANGWAGLKFSAAGLGVAALIFLPLFALRFLGGGDVKIMGAIGALAGYENLLVIFIFDAILGGVVAVVMMIVRGRVKKTMSNLWQMIKALSRGKAPYRENEELEAGSERSLGMPRAVTIAAATLLILWLSRVPVPPGR